jgi:general L-amino acid transport system permease protein
MAYADEAPKQGFRLSMLIYDTRYRSMTIQIIVLILVGLFFSWLINNTITNLAAKDRTFDYGFLWNRAGYDINQTLIPYTNDSTHFRALLVGLVNTLLVAIIGCFLATVLGVVIGVLRLSKNWLIGRITTVYVEVFRNVPLLLWIILAYTIFAQTMPEPREFKITADMVQQGIDPTHQKILFDTVAITNRGVNIPTPLLDRPLGSVTVLDIPVSLSLLAAIGVIIASFWINARIRARAKAIQEDTGLRPVTWWKSLLVLIAPITILLVALGFHLDVPGFPVDENGVSRGFNFVGGINLAHSFTALLIALSVYHGTYIAEAVRAGILAISRGQTEAAYALGLRPNRTMSLIILPQALRVIIPPLISQFLNLTKNTTLGMAISYMDLKGTLGGITLNQTGRELESMLLMMLIYLILSLAISLGMNIFNNSVKLKER